jgi:ankyrin repeat protein
MKSILWFLLFLIPASIEAIAGGVSRNDVGETERLQMAPVYAFLEHGGNPNARNHFGGTLLETATNWNYNQIVKSLLLKGADPNQCRPSNECALFIATGRDTEILRMLVAAGADVNRSTTSHETILGRAAGSQLRTFKNLTKTGGYRGSLPDLVESVRILLAAGANINEIDGSGRSALRNAMLSNNIEIARLLLQAGADVNQPVDKQHYGTGPGATILMETIGLYPQYKDISAIKLLLDFGANPQDQSNEPYDGYAESRGWEWNGYSVLGYSAKHGFYNVVKLLLDRGADPMIGRNDGRSALELAIQNGHTKTAALLMRHTTKQPTPPNSSLQRDASPATLARAPELAR